MDALSVEEVARLLGLTARRVRALIATGRLPATRIGLRAWAIVRSDALAFSAVPRSPGRPSSRTPAEVARRLHEITTADGGRT